MRTIDINCDVGEGMANESLLMPFLSSCSIACGGHYGTKSTMDASIQLALKHNVKIGAHPSFPDQEHFGRVMLDMSPDDLKKSIQSQLEIFIARLSLFNAKLHHIKAHGALYNLIAKDAVAADNFLLSIQKYLSDCYVYVPYDSAIETKALEKGVPIKYEAFADRNYHTDLSLVSRSHDHAVLSDPTAVCHHIKQMLFNNQVATIEGALCTIKAETLCVHGDHSNSLEILKAITQFLKQHHIQLG